MERSKKSIHTDTNYQKSKNGHQCISPCYKKGIFALHPISLVYTTNYNSNYCLIEPENGRDADECEGFAESKFMMTENFEKIFINPGFETSSDEFLKLHHDLNSMEDVLVKLKDDSMPILSRYRILENAWIAFVKIENGVNAKNYLLDKTICDFYYKIIIKLWVYDLYNFFYEYLCYKNNNIDIVRKKKNKDKKIYERIDEKIEFLREFISKEMISDYFSSFVEKSEKEIINTFGSHKNTVRSIANFLEKEILKKI